MWKIVSLLILINTSVVFAYDTTHICKKYKQDLAVAEVELAIAIERRNTIKPFDKRKQDLTSSQRSEYVGLLAKIDELRIKIYWLKFQLKDCD